MKRIFLNVILAIVGLACFSVGLVEADKPERIEVLYTQKLSNIVGVIVLHDKDSGMEENCVVAIEGQFTGSERVTSISCIPTGRNWK